MYNAYTHDLCKVVFIVLLVWVMYKCKCEETCVAFIFSHEVKSGADLT